MYGILERGSQFQTLPRNTKDHDYFGIRQIEGGWIYREWAPDARQLYFVGEFNGWNRQADPMFPLGNGGWVLYLHGDHALWEGCQVKTIADAGDRVLREGVIWQIP